MSPAEEALWADLRAAQAMTDRVKRRAAVFAARRALKLAARRSSLGPGARMRIQGL